MRRIATAVVTLVVAAGLAACNGDGAADGSPEPSGDGDFASQVLETRDEAQADGASEAQIAILDEAAASGQITMEQELAARDLYAECLTAGGYILHDAGIATDQGFAYPDYRVEIPAGGENDEFMEECERTHFLYVDMLFQTQPSAQSGKDDQFAKAMPVLIDCLNNGGLEVDADATADELKEIMIDDVRASFSDDPNHVPTVRENLVSTCLDVAGINGF